MKAANVLVPSWPRHHLGVALAVPLAVVGLLVLAVAAPGWLGWPTATNTHALFPFLFGAPLLAAVQAYESARQEQHAVAATWVARTRRVKLRENGRCLAGAWLAATLCALTWYLVARIATAMNPLGQAQASLRPILGYLALVLLAIGVGHLIGKLRLRAAVSSATAFVTMLLVALYGTQYGNSSPEYVIAPEPLLALGISAVVVTVAALISPLDRRWGIAHALLPLLVVVVVTASTVGRASVVLRPDADGVCAGEDGALVCVWREHEAALVPLTDIAESIREVAPATMPIPERLQEFGLDGTANASYSLNLTNSDVHHRPSLTTAYVLALSNHVFAGRGNSDEGRAARVALEALLAVAAEPDLTDGQAARGLLYQDDVARARAVVASGKPSTAAYAEELFARATQDLE